jgi:hypothetical protein
MTLFESHSADQGTTWSASKAIRSDGLNFLPWVAARGNGTVAIGWYGGDAAGRPEKADNESAWFAYAAQSTDGGATFQVAKVREEPVKVGPLCPKGAACQQDRELLDYVSLAYDPEGRVHYAFTTSRELAGAKSGLVNYAGLATR